MFEQKSSTPSSTPSSTSNNTSNSHNIALLNKQHFLKKYCGDVAITFSVELIVADFTLCAIRRYSKRWQTEFRGRACQQPNVLRETFLRMLSSIHLPLFYTQHRWVFWCVMKKRKNTSCKTISKFEFKIQYS